MGDSVFQLREKREQTEAGREREREREEEKSRLCLFFQQMLDGVTASVVVIKYKYIHANNDNGRY